MSPILICAVALVNQMLSNPSDQHDILAISSKTFSYELSTGKKGRTWKNFGENSQVTLGSTPEVEIEMGDNPASPIKVQLQPHGSPEISDGGSNATLRFQSDDGSLLVAVSYAVDPNWPIMHKRVQVTNNSSHALRLLNVILGRFPVGTTKTEGGERGFPLYLNKQFFVSITHPAGFAHIEGKEVVLRQYPGTTIAPGKTFRSMEAIYGVAKTGQSRTLFVDYVNSKMCRTLYGQDKPYAILESFGGQQTGNYRNDFSVGVSESYLHDHLADVATSKRHSGVNFDFYSMEFWHDRAGDLTTFNRTNFPNGFDKVRDEILSLGMKPALWIDSGGLPDWSIDLNPMVKNCRTHTDGTGSFCRASEPIAHMYKDAYLRHMRDNHVGLVKFDNLGADGRPPVCYNANHEHLPGPLYSTEAIFDSVIDFLSTLRKANPEIFIMLYWGYNSPWWLQWGDTYFECGAPIEGASPAQYPTPYARDAVTQRLDQAQLTIEDTPWLGKDSLGVWLSNWPWNSSIGKPRWQEGTIMDMARGSLLFQLWTDEHFLTPPEREQAATFINLMKANPDCFEHSRFILGNANKSEPYGYSCTNGNRAFLCLNNASLKDQVVRVNLDHSIGLPDGREWDVYRWYPNPVQVRQSEHMPFTMAFRPYEVALLEIVPTGEKPSLGRKFRLEETGLAFSEKSRALTCKPVVRPTLQTPSGTWTSLKPLSTKSEKGTTLRTNADGSILASGLNPSRDTYTISLRSDVSHLAGLMLEALTDPSLPAGGPGRAVNGNFALLNMRVQVALPDHPDQLQELKLKTPRADFFQTSFGGWSPDGIIDTDPKSGWSIHPRVGESHIVTFEFESPTEFPKGSTLVVTMSHDDRGHNLGRFRFWVTQDLSPAFPATYQPVSVSYTYRIPPTKTGGLLFLVGGNGEDKVFGSIDGHPLEIASVWASDSNWSCPWTAWRARIAPSDQSRKVEVRMDRTQSRTTPKFEAHFLPD